MLVLLRSVLLCKIHVHVFCIGKGKMAVNEVFSIDQYSQAMIHRLFQCIIAKK